MTLVFKSANPMFRYVLWFAAILFLVLFFNLRSNEPSNNVKQSITFVGILLFVTSGFLYVCRKYTFDLERRLLMCVETRWNRTITANISFSEIGSIASAPTQSSYEDSLGRTRMKEEWIITMEVQNKIHSLPGISFEDQQSANLYSQNLAKLLSVTAQDSDPIDLLIRLGRTVDAITYLRKLKGITLAEANAIVQSKVDGKK